MLSKDSAVLWTSSFISWIFWSSEKSQLNSTNETMSFVSPQRWALTAVWLPLQEVALVLHLWSPIVFGIRMISYWRVRWQRRWRTLRCHRPLAPVVQLDYINNDITGVQRSFLGIKLNHFLLESWTYLVIIANNENKRTGNVFYMHRKLNKCIMLLCHQCRNNSCWHIL